MFTKNNINNQNHRLKKHDDIWHKALNIAQIVREMKINILTILASENSMPVVIHYNCLAQWLSQDCKDFNVHLLSLCIICLNYCCCFLRFTPITDNPIKAFHLYTTLVLYTSGVWCDIVMFDRLICYFYLIL